MLVLLPFFFATFYPNFTSTAVDNAATLSHDTSLVLDVIVRATT